MERADVYRAIDSERVYQQAQNEPDERDKYEWENSITYYFRRATFTKDMGMWTSRILKVTALCVAAMEQYGVEPRAGYEQPQMPQLEAKHLHTIAEELRFRHAYYAELIAQNEYAPDLESNTLLRLNLASWRGRVVGIDAVLALLAQGEGE